LASSTVFTIAAPRRRRRAPVPDETVCASAFGRVELRPAVARAPRLAAILQMHYVAPHAAARAQDVHRPRAGEPGRCCDDAAECGARAVRPGKAPGMITPPAEELSHMMNVVRNFLRDENGEDLIEYGLLAAFVAAVALVTIILDPIGIKGSLVNAFTRAKDALDKQ
jgi:Flp pilus assembly pilin Flp